MQGPYSSRNSKFTNCKSFLSCYLLKYLIFDFQKKVLISESCDYTELQYEDTQSTRFNVDSSVRFL